MQRWVPAAALLSIVLAGCTNEPDLTLTLTVDSDKPSVVVNAERVLLARFEMLRPGLLATVESHVDGSLITFVFRHGAPDPAVLEYLYHTQGVVRASLAEGLHAELFSDRDVRDATLGYSDSHPWLQLRLTPEAGARLLKLTSENVGKVAVTTLDGEVLMRARINGAFGEKLEITLPEIQRRELVVVLRSGALPAAVTRQAAGRLRGLSGERGERE